MKHKNIITVLIFAFLLFGTSAVCFVKTPSLISESERRELKQKPKLTITALASGQYMKDFEEYTVDQFPKRDLLRSVKAVFSTRVFMKKDNNGYYFANGHISKLEYPLNPYMLDNAEEKFVFLYDSFLKNTNTNIYLSVIPDKNYFLAKDNGYLSMDYDVFLNDFKDRFEFMKYIDVSALLTIDDYYKTDSHWKQDCIFKVARKLSDSMGTAIDDEYEIKTLDNEFKGVYLSQSALPYKGDKIRYVTNKHIDNAKVTYVDDMGMKKEGSMYDFEKAKGKDPYEMFLSGTQALITIENPYAKSDKELVIFRDSYGSSLVPLLTSGYKKITVVDIRYIQKEFVGSFVKFDKQDVLFMYSTTLLNNSTAFK